MGEYLFTVQNGVIQISKWGQSEEDEQRRPISQKDWDFTEENFREASEKFLSLVASIQKHEEMLQKQLA